MSKYIRKNTLVGLLKCTINDIDYKSERPDYYLGYAAGLEDVLAIINGNPKGPISRDFNLEWHDVMIREIASIIKEGSLNNDDTLEAVE